jgi:hypothetical protein
MILRLWDWMVLYIPFMSEFDRFVKKIVINHIKKKLKK